MEAFCPKYSAKLDARIVVNKCGCQIWQEAKKVPVCYGVIKAKFPDTGWHTLHAHKLRYLVHNRVISVDGALEVSHLCHKPLCINAEHLSLEPHRHRPAAMCEPWLVSQAHQECMLFQGKVSEFECKSVVHAFLKFNSHAVLGMLSLSVQCQDECMSVY